MKKIIALFMACAIFPTSSYAYHDPKENINKINEMALSICESDLEGKLISYMKYDDKNSEPLCYSNTTNFSFYNDDSLILKDKKYNLFSEDVREELLKESKECVSNFKTMFVIFNPINREIAKKGCKISRAKKL